MRARSSAPAISNDCRVCVQVGDRIVSINGQSLDALSHRDVVGVLKEASGNVCLQVLRTRRHKWFIAVIDLYRQCFTRAFQVVADTNVAAILSRMENLSGGGSAFLPPVGAAADHAHPQ